MPELGGRFVNRAPQAIDSAQRKVRREAMPGSEHETFALFAQLGRVEFLKRDRQGCDVHKRH